MSDRSPIRRRRGGLQAFEQRRGGQDLVLFGPFGVLADVRSRFGDTVARLGGDEFVILAEDAGGPAELEALAARIRRALSEPLVLNNRRIFPGVSIGFALADETLDPVLLLRRADAAMY